MYSKTIFFQLILFICLTGTAPSFSHAEDPPGSSEVPEDTNKAKPQEQTFTSVEERRLYTILQNERDNLEEEKKVLALKEKELKTLQEEADKKIKLLDEKLAELQKVQAKIEELLAQKDAEELKKN